MTRCPRTFEAEAARDGRLAGAERASFERHAASCADCAGEVRALEGLGAALRTGGSEADDLRVRRERTRLLAAFDRSLVAPERRWKLRPWMAAPPVLAAAAALLVRTPMAPPVASSPGAVVRAEGTAVWSDRREGGREEVRLDRGALWIHVVPEAEGHLLVRLPDGELEDTGTTFTVSADGGRTTRVAVEEGRVALRIHGLAEVSLGAGEVWVPALPVATDSPRPSLRPADAPPAPSSSARLASPRVASHAPDASADFREAMAAFDAGNAREAATRFAAFVARHAGDARAEDAAYLEVIALQRCGDRAGVGSAAADYLRRYPAGFRRSEVEAMSR